MQVSSACGGGGGGVAEPETVPREAWKHRQAGGSSGPSSAVLACVLPPLSMGLFVCPWFAGLQRLPQLGASCRGEMGTAHKLDLKKGGLLTFSPVLSHKGNQPAD